MRTEHEEHWLEDWLARLAGARVAVFGDFCLDAYWEIDPDQSELSVETGLPVRRVRSQRYSPGGAGNVVANLAGLGVAEVHAVGLIGNDLFGHQLVELLSECGANATGMLQCQDNWQTMVYTKPCVGAQEQSRIDFGAFNELHPETMTALAEELERAVQACDVVILNQQVPAGVSTPPMIARINDVIAAHPNYRFLVDSRDRVELYGAAMVKLNTHEAARLCGRPQPLHEPIPAESARECAAELFKRTRQPVFVTCAQDGIVVADTRGVHEVPGIQVPAPIDPVGAGDTVSAALAAVIASGGDCLTAARLANIAASVTVRKLQTTGVATPDEIRRAAAGRDQASADR